MTHLRRSMLGLVVYMAVFLNIERLDLGQPNPINLASLVYVVALVSVVAILTIPWMTRMRPLPLVMLWLAIYLASRLALFAIDSHKPLIGGVYTYLFITEASLLSITVLLAHRVADNLADFEEAVRIITFAGVSHRVRPLSSANEEINREILRSRRHHYPLSVIVLEPDPGSVSLMLNRSVQEIQKSMMSRYALSNIVRIVSNMMRRTDLIIDQSSDKSNLVVFCPDTDEPNADLLKERILSTIQSQIGVKMCVGQATFPDDALTFDELVKIANEQIECYKASQPASQEPAVVIEKERVNVEL